jgi:uncharacterized membrane protein
VDTARGRHCVSVEKGLRMQITPVEGFLEVLVRMVIVPLPIGIFLMAAIAGPRLKKVWLAALSATFVISFLAAWIDQWLLGWIATSVVAYTFRRPAKDNFMTKPKD